MPKPRLTLPVVVSLALLVGAGVRPAGAQTAWVGGEVKLNLRTGPSPDYRITKALTTGDQVTILDRQESWTRIRTDAGDEGWIPAGYLESSPPPGVRLAQLEGEVASLRERLEQTTSEAEALRAENESLSTLDEEQQTTLETLRRENLDLKAGARWPYLVTGASILLAGMVLGALLSRSGGRRKPKIKL